MERQAFLTKVAQRLGHSRPRSGAEWDDRPSLPRPYGDVDLEWASDRFMRELKGLGGFAERLPDFPAATARLVAIAVDASRTYGSQTVLLSAEAELAPMGLPAALAAVGLEAVFWDPAAPPGAMKTLAERCCLGITGADAAVVETGSIVLSASPERGRLISLLPPVHAAVVPAAKLVPSAAEVFRGLALQGTMPSQVIFATGPSKSADIEFDLSIGVHGPCETYTLLVG